MKNENIKAYFDGELNEAEAKAMAKAIENDPELQSDADWLRTIRAEFNELKDTPEPTGKEQLLKKLAESPRKSKFNMPIGLRFATGGFAIIAMLAVIGSLDSIRNGGVTSAFFGRPSAASAQAPGTSATAGETADGFKMAPQGDKGDVESPSAMGKAANPMEGRSVGGAGSVDADDSARKSEQNPTYDYKTTNGATSTAPPPLGSLMNDRSLVFTAALGIEVPNVGNAVESATIIVRGLGGYVESTNVSAMVGASQNGELRVRVPSKLFDSAVKQFSQLGKVLSHTSAGEDVTAQIVDLDARIKTLAAEEQQYRELLRQARRISDIMEIRDRLTEIRSEIESMQAQRKTFQNMASLSTITLSFTTDDKVNEPKPEDGNWSNDAWNTSVDALTAIGKAVARGSIFVFVMAPFWIPITLIGYLIYRKTKA